MTSHKYEGKIENIVTNDRWMEEPHKKLLEPCVHCGGKVEESEPRESPSAFDDKLHLEYWYKCQECRDALGFIEVAIENTGGQSTLEGFQEMLSRG